MQKLKLESIHSLKRLSHNFYQIEIVYDYPLEKITNAHLRTDDQVSQWIARNVFKLNMDVFSAVKSMGIVHCSSFSVTLQGDVFACHNEDLEPGIVLLIKTRPKSGFKSLGLTFGYYTGLAGEEIHGIREKLFLLASPLLTSEGMNERGFSITTLSISGETEFVDNQKPAFGSLLLIRYLLDNAGSIGEAIDMSGKFNIWYNGNHRFQYFMADGSGDSAVMWFEGGKIHTIKGIDDRFFATNFIPTRENIARNDCKRYGIIKKEIDRINDLAGIQNLLAAVRQDETMWSSIHNLTKKESRIFINGKFDRSFDFSL